MPEQFSFRWGIPLLDDLEHVVIYHFLLDHYAELGVTPTEMMFIIHLSQFRYESAKGRAAPSLGTIARLMGYRDEQQARRLKRELKKKKLLTVTEQPGRPNVYDFTAFAKKAFTLWHREHAESQEAADSNTAAQTGHTPIRLDTPIQSDRGSTEQIDPTPIRLDTPPLSNLIGEELEEKENHGSPPPCDVSSADPPGGGGGDSSTVKPNKTELYYWLLDAGVKSPDAAERNQHHDPTLTQTMFREMVGDAIGEDRERKIGRFMKMLTADGPRVRKKPRPAVPRSPAPLLAREGVLTDAELRERMPATPNWRQKT